MKHMLLQCDKGIILGKRIIITLSVIWTAAVIAFMLILFFPWIHSTDGITKDMSYAESEGDIYIAENVFDHAVIYDLDDTGNMKNILIGRNNYNTKDYRVSAVTYWQSLFVLFSYDTVYNGREITVYRLARLDDKLVVSQLSEYLVLGDEIRITHLSADDKDVYISATNTSGSEAYAYQVSQDVLKDIANESGFDLKNVKDKMSGSKSSDETAVEEQFTEVTPFEFDVAESGRVYADCAYEPGSMNIRYDNEKLEDIFVIPGRVKTAYVNLHITGVLYNRMRGINPAVLVVIWILGIPVIIIMTLILNGRNRVVYTGLVVESALMIIFAAGTLSVIKSVSALSNSEHTSYTAYIMNDAFTNINMDTEEFELSDLAKEDMLTAYYDSNIYTEMYRQLTDMTTIPEDNWRISGMSVVNQKTGEVLVSDKRYNRAHASELYGKAAAEFVQVNNAGNALRTKSIKSDEGERIVLARSLDGIGLNGYTLVGIVCYQNSMKNAATVFNRFIKGAIIGFLLSTLAVIVLLVLENRDIRALAKMLKLLAEGRGVNTNPTVRGKDLTAMKNSVYEIDKNIASINRAKYKIFEAYYRFAPKSIEVMLDKDSITEVEIGDIANISGTIAILSMKDKYRADKESLDYMNKTFEIMEKSREEHGGIYVAGNETLKRARYLFTDEDNKAVAFGVDVLNGLREWRKRDYVDTLVLLHSSTFSYGICGTETQSMPLMTSRDMEKLSSITEWLRDLRVSMVITKTVLDKNIGIDYEDVRYLGFIRTEEIERLELYEIISAQGGRFAASKKDKKEEFESAIELFYAKDFYLARNAFTDILRDIPEDGLAKWYLFECETQLNDDAEDIFTGALHL